MLESLECESSLTFHLQNMGQDLYVSQDLFIYIDNDLVKALLTYIKIFCIIPDLLSGNK